MKGQRELRLLPHGVFRPHKRSVGRGWRDHEITDDQVNTILYLETDLRGVAPCSPQSPARAAIRSWYLVLGECAYSPVTFAGFA